LSLDEEAVGDKVKNVELDEVCIEVVEDEQRLEHLEVKIYNRVC
jgi:hypothetical protein